MSTLTHRSLPVFSDEQLFMVIGDRPDSDVAVTNPQSMRQEIFVAANARSAAQAFLESASGSWRCACVISLAEARPLLGEVVEAAGSPERFAQWVFPTPRPGRVPTRTLKLSPWLLFYKPDSTIPGERGARQIVLASGFDAIISQCSRDEVALACALPPEFLYSLIERLTEARETEEHVHFVPDFTAGLIAPPRLEDSISAPDLERELEERV